MASGEQQELTVVSLRSLSQQYNRNAGYAQEVANFLRGQNSSMYWQSEASQAFKSSVDKYIQALNRFNESFTSLSRELETRAQVMEESQRSPGIG